MKVLPNRELLYAHPYAYALLVLLHHVLIYLESAVDEAPFGFVAEELQKFSWIDIPHNIDERYSDYLHRIVAKKGGVYGVWMQLKTKQGSQDVVLLTLFIRQEPLPFSVVVPVEQPHKWWVES